jgi:hypothetical protein
METHFIYVKKDTLKDATEKLFYHQVDKLKKSLILLVVVLIQKLSH